jgi:uroporphyrinogen decarboxylase
MHATPDRIDIAAGKKLIEDIGDAGIVVGDMYSPIDTRDAMKPIDFMMLYYDDREAFAEIVSIGAEAMMAETREVLEAGFDIVKTWWFYCSPSYGWSPEIYEKIFLPHLVKQAELVHSYGAKYIYYDDGKLSQFADFYVSAGIDCLMTCAPPPLGDADPADLKRKYGDKICIMGGFDAVNEIYLGTPDSIRETVKTRLEIFMPGGGYIMDGSNSLVYETPPENVRAFAEAGSEFGVYR